MNDMWEGGTTNPLTVIEQLTYLIFIRSLDDKDVEAEQFENVSNEKMLKFSPKPSKGNK